jgi:hypothetical protein
MAHYGGLHDSKIQLCSKREEWTAFFSLARQSQWGIGGTYTYSNLHITLRNWVAKLSINSKVEISQPALKGTGHDLSVG